MNKWTYFKDSEVEGLKDELLIPLDKARGIAQVPFIITSSVRSLAENKSVSGVEDSSHLSGLAVDLEALDSRTRFLIVSALLQEGFTRIGIYDKHIHADVDFAKDQQVIWTGVSH